MRKIERDSVKVIIGDKEYLPRSIHMPCICRDEVPTVEIEVVLADSYLNKSNKIEKVIFNPPATIVYWCDGTKTVVKTNKEEFDPEKGLAMAICKKHFGNKGNFNNVFKKWVK